MADDKPETRSPVRLDKERLRVALIASLLPMSPVAVAAAIGQALVDRLVDRYGISRKGEE